MVVARFRLYKSLKKEEFSIKIEQILNLKYLDSFFTK